MLITLAGVRTAGSTGSPSGRWPGRLAGAVAAATAATTLAAVAMAAAPAAAVADGGRIGGWAMGGHDLANTRSNPLERTVSPATAPGLVQTWTATVTGDVSATPAVVGGAVYVPDWGGTLWKLDARTGAVIWSHQVGDYVGIAGAVSRTSPAVTAGTVYLGTQQGAWLLAVDAATGDLRWRRQLSTHPWAVLTQSPVVHHGVVYQGVSSNEEVAAIDPTYPCCTFRGSLAAVDARTGRPLWQTSTIDDQGPGSDIFSGAAVWGSTPTIDPATGTVFVTTGNNYSISSAAEACQDAGGTPQQCLPPWNRFNSIIAMDLRTGAIRWSTGQDRFDTWNGACIPGLPPNNCPNSPGGDFDFGDGTHLFTLPGPHGHPRPAVGAGQKSGEYWMLDAATGAVLWSSAVGPGSALGGIEWGTATDGRRIYFAETDLYGTPYQLPDGQTITSSSFGALDAATGRVVWQVPEPHGGLAIAAVSTANDVAFGCSLAGQMYAFAAATGRLLWEAQGLGACAAGPAVAGGHVYWGNGYARVQGAAASTTFYAFAPAARRP